MKQLAIVAAALLASGCAFAARPTVTVAEVALPPAFTFAPHAAEQATLAGLLPGADPAFQALRAAAWSNAPDLAAALARIDAARASADRARAERLPQIDGAASVETRRQNVSQFGPASSVIDEVQTSYAASMAARWDADLFGQLRARSRAASARLNAATADAAAVRLALAANIAANVSDWRTLQRREAALQADLSAAGDLARLSGVRERAGLSPGADRVRAEALAAASRSRLVALGSERARIIGQLVTLTAQPAGPVLAALSAPAPQPIAIVAPTSLPSTLLTRRPDVLAAGARLRAADADLAAAAAARFPKLSLSAGIGLLAYGLSSLIDTDSIVGNLGAQIAAPLLDFGRLRADQNRARAGTAEALANYRNAVFQALGDAESGYALVASAAAEADALRTQAEQQERAANLVQVRYRAGLTNFLDVLEARRAATGAREAVAAAEGRLARARVLLWQALGGD